MTQPPVPPSAMLSRKLTQGLEKLWYQSKKCTWNLTLMVILIQSVSKDVWIPSSISLLSYLPNKRFFNDKINIYNINTNEREVIVIFLWQAASMMRGRTKCSRLRGSKGASCFILTMSLKYSFGIGMDNGIKYIMWYFLTH